MPKYSVCEDQGVHVQCTLFKLTICPQILAKCYWNVLSLILNLIQLVNGVKSADDYLLLIVAIFYALLLNINLSKVTEQLKRRVVLNETRQLIILRACFYARCAIYHEMFSVQFLAE